MSAFYAFRYADRICVLTDGAFIDGADILRHVGQKVFANPRLPIAITGQGDFGFIAQIGGACIAEGHATVDEKMHGIQTYLHHVADVGGVNARLLLAAFSETDGLVLKCADCRKCDDNESLCQFVDYGNQVAAGPAISSGEMMAFGADLASVDDPDFPEKNGVSIIAAMRSTSCTRLEDESNGFYVGGCVDLTTVRSSGISLRRLHTFDDVIGSPIDPTRDGD